jgi:hypothetical protein
MNRIAPIVFGIIGVAILMIIFPIIMDSTHELETDPQVDTFAAVTTGAGETAANVVLTRDLYNDSNTSVLTIISDLPTDNPVAGTYTPATNTLNVTGLTAGSSRTLTITYEYAALTDYTGMDAMVGMTPLLIWVAILAIVVGGTWFAMKGN